MGKISCTRCVHKNTYPCSPFSFSFNLLLAHHQTLTLSYPRCLLQFLNACVVCLLMLVDDSSLVYVVLVVLFESMNYMSFTDALSTYKQNTHTQSHSRKKKFLRKNIILFNVFGINVGLIKFQHMYYVNACDIALKANHRCDLCYEVNSFRHPQIFFNAIIVKRLKQL